MKSERCERCRDEDTVKCQTCNPSQPEEMTLTYSFVIKDSITNIEGLQNDLDLIVKCAGHELVSSTLKSPEEESEHEFREGAEEEVIKCQTEET